ncbi:hypothetical protein SNE40_014749 [Patella caerulea]|uniref:Neprilysin n=2 Tax=Patella caerulea TaxID=87958 RepID=A0AAN8JKP5_PATCE
MSSAYQARYMSPVKEDQECNGGTNLSLNSTGVNNVKKTGNSDLDPEEPMKNAQIHFLPKPSQDSRVCMVLSRWTNREKYLGALCLLLFVACVVFIIVAFTRSGLLQGHPEGFCNSRKCVQTAAKLMEGMDFTADPCEDFFKYACGQWNKKHVIPEDKSSFNTFEKLHDELQIILKGQLEEPPSIDDNQASIKAKILYKSCVNVTQLEKVGVDPLRKVLDNLGKWPVIEPTWDSSNFVVEDMLGYLRGQYNAPILIDCWVGADDKNSSANIIQLDQPVLGMPSREYYLNDKDSENIRAYRKYMYDMAMLLGATEESAKIDLQNVFDFETRLANVTKPQAERHDTGAIYTKVTIKRLQQMTTGFDWLEYFRKFIPSEITEDESVVLFAKDYLINMLKILQNTPPRTIANYVIWRVLLGFAPELTEDFQKIRNEYRRVLQGVKRDKIRWQKCVEYVNERLGMAVGAMFIEDNFKKESKDTALEMIHDIRAAFNELLEENDWMDEETKAFAREKANAMNERIGYPEFITDSELLDKRYELLDFSDDQYFQNVLQLEKGEAIKTMKKLREPVKKDIWEQDPAVVNAFYNPNTNDIVFPAGILQPLFYSATFPKSLNYGGIGVVIGHEITHGFDDKGRQYDKDGNLKQWWKNETIEAFRKRAECMVEQYSKYKLDQIDLPIDGRNTQGENIADNGGLKEAYRAYQKWVQHHGEELLLPGIGLNHRQLFFLNYAQIWCGKMRDEEALHKIRTSVHSPGPVRVLGPLSNSVEFAKAYHCPLGSRMNPKHKCSVW